MRSATAAEARTWSRPALVFARLPRPLPVADGSMRRRHVHPGTWPVTGPSASPGPWRNRIVGTGDAAPDQLLANPRNWRTHPVSQQGALESVLDEVGWVGQVLVNRRTGHLVDGHLRVEIALRREEPSVPVTYVELSEEEEALVLATLDPLAAMADTDSAKLRELLDEIAIPNGDLAALLAELSPKDPSGLTDPDEVPDLPEEPYVKPGELWIIGDHRLLCGDSTSAESYARLMDGGHDQVLLTDPPYGVNYSETVDGRGNQKQGGWRPIANDGLRGEALYELMRAAFGASQARTALVWFGHEARHGTERALEDAGFKVAQEIVWVKNALVMSRGADYHWRHEQAVYAKRKGHRAPPTRDQNTVWEVHKTTGAQHPTQKPVELYEIPLRNHTVPGEILFDPFAGSGTAFIAAERLGRRCYGIELEPRYVQVIIERWQAFTGKEAVRG